jgi:signal transduction histidine kinase
MSTRFDEAVQLRVAESMHGFCYGLTHEINNPLANISARAQGLLAQAADEATRQTLHNILLQTQRAHEMLAEMMLAVRPPQMKLVHRNASELLSNITSKFDRQAAHRQISLKSTIDERYLPVQVDEIALTESLQAIFQNALDASEVGSCIELRCERIEPAHEEINSGAMPEVRIAIIDNGHGMSPEAIHKAFDLYYCGREAGRSLGIGLSKAKRIIEAHGGRIWIESQPTIGTCVELRLPWKFAQSL